MGNDSILFTIAIPTWNRAAYLRLNLAQLETETIGKTHLVEILISDNCSTDETAATVSEFTARGMKMRYIRNPENIGSDHNIAQCFNEAAGQYVLILGDDDMLVDGALGKLLKELGGNRYGVVFLRPYGYDKDFRAERPATRPDNAKYASAGEFIAKIGALAGLISSNVINKQILTGENADKYCGTNLVQTYLVYDAAIKSGRNLVMNEYLIAYKRNNWGYYPFSQVFVDRFWAVVDYFRQRGLDQAATSRLARNMLVGYYPFYIFKMRMKSSDSLQEDYQRFLSRFRNNPWFWITLAPQFKLPRPLALIWGGIVVAVGRSLTGDAYRGFSFVRSLLARKLGRKTK